MVHLQLVISAFLVVVGVLQVDGARSDGTPDEAEQYMNTWFGNEGTTITSDGTTITGILLSRQTYTVQDLKQALATVNAESLRAVLGLNEGFESDTDIDVNFSEVFARIIAALGGGEISYETAVIFVEAVDRVGSGPNGYSPWIDKNTVRALKTIFYIIIGIKQRLASGRIYNYFLVRHIENSLIPEAFILFYPCTCNDTDLAFFRNLHRLIKYTQEVVDVDADRRNIAAQCIVLYLGNRQPGIRAMNAIDADSKRESLQRIIDIVAGAADIVRDEAGPFQ